MKKRLRNKIRNNIHGVKPWANKPVPETIDVTPRVGAVGYVEDENAINAMNQKYKRIRFSSNEREMD